MVRNILSVIAAFVIGGLCVFGVEALGHVVYPIPATVDQSNLQSLAEYAKTMPIGAMLFVLLAQSAGSVVGGLVTGVISTAKTVTALVYGILALIMAGLNVFLLPHPIWFSALALILPIPLSFIGSKIGQSFGGGKS